MKSLYTFLIGGVLLVTGCKQDDQNGAPCFGGAPTTRHIINKPATVQLSGGEYYIVEQHTIDTRLLPCYLKQEFRISGLSVKVSGEVKGSIPGSNGPCCTEGLIIAKITR